MPTIRNPTESLKEALKCRVCGAVQTIVEEEPPKPGGFVKGECILISCPRTGCETPWFHCVSCKKRRNQNNIGKHPQQENHKKCHALTYGTEKPAGGDQGHDEVTVDAFQQFTAEEDEASVADKGTDELLCEIEKAHQAHIETAMDQDLEGTFHENADEAMAGDYDEQTEILHPVEVFPPVNSDGNEWLLKAMSGIQRATLAEMHDAFSSPDVNHMKTFWLAEAGSGPGKCGGGLCYLAARGFQCQPDSRLDKAESSIPDFKEALWHFNKMLQCHSMNDGQRGRQAKLNKQSVDESFFKQTYLPGYHQLSRYYGTGSQYSMYRSLPTPRSRNVTGVAYVSPMSIIAYSIANGIPNDDFLILAPKNGAKPVMNVEDCRKAREWAASVKARYKPKDGEPGPIALGAVLWKDGFCYNNCKAQRSLDVLTMSFGAPKDLINGTDNTFPVAVGWNEVEQLLTSDFKELESEDTPRKFYN